MGAPLSACCKTSFHETAADITPPAVYSRNFIAKKDFDGEFKNTSGIQPTYLNPTVKNAFKRRLESGIGVTLILQDKTKLSCQVRLDPSSQIISLSCAKKVRSIRLQDVIAILHTAEHLRRVESSAGISDFDTCAAIHLAETGKCIPLFFNELSDKHCFVCVVEEAKEAAMI